MGRTGVVYGTEAGFAAAVAAAAGIPVGQAEIGAFADGEPHVRLGDGLAGRAAVLVASTGPPVAANLLTLACLADAARRAGASPIVAVVPYFGLARGDHQAETGTPIPARLAADWLQGTGVTHLITVDLHSPAVAGFFTIPVVELTAVDGLAAALAGVSAAHHVVVAPDAGAIKRVSRVAHAWHLPMALAAKARPRPGAAEVLALWGDVAGRQAIVVDDMVSTGGTVAAVARRLHEAGAVAVDLVATHAVMVPGAEETLRGAGIRRFITTDTLPYVPASPWSRVDVLTVAPQLGRAVRACLADSGGSKTARRMAA